MIDEHNLTSGDPGPDYACKMNIKDSEAQMLESSGDPMLS